ncbi:hypothetical protein TNCV_2370821 [Trichonephila clavipes]|nr:hypothetical protein TNCV_2370821 [Trichonephila clavipes]
MDGLKYLDILKAVRMADLQDLKSALLHALKLETTTQVSRRDIHFIRGVKVIGDANNDFPWMKDIKNLRVAFQKLSLSTVLMEHPVSTTGGHFGVMKSFQKIQERFYWNNVRSDVEKWYRTCDPCASRKGPGKALEDV